MRCPFEQIEPEHHVTGRVVLKADLLSTFTASKGQPSVTMHGKQQAESYNISQDQIIVAEGTS